MNFSMKKTVIGMAGGLLVAAQVSAAPIIDWEWSLDAGWSAFSPAGVEPVNPVDGVQALNGDAIAAWDTLQWGTPSNEAGLNPGLAQSSVVVGNPNLDSRDFAGTGAETLVLVDQGDGTWYDQVNGTEFTHNNNTIQGISLTDMVLSEVFRIVPQFAVPVDPTAPLGPIAAAPSFELSFLETTNLRVDGDPNDTSRCDSAYQNPGSLYPCDDIFVILNPEELTFSFTAPDNYIYTIDVTVDGLDPLGDACSDFGAADNCLGLITEEASSNTFQFLIALSARKIPEPSVLALMGLGLLGLGYRRRQSKK